MLTIGYGHTGSDVSSGQLISEERAVELLRADVKTAEAAVRNSVKVELLPNQFDALVSFTYNVGVDAFKDSTLLKKINAGLFEDVPGQFGRWVKGTINGEKVTLPGLVNRRNAEIDVWNDDGLGRTELMNRAVRGYDYSEAARQAMKIDQTPGELGLTDVYPDSILRRVASASSAEQAKWAISQMEADGAYVDPIIRAAATAGRGSTGGTTTSKQDSYADRYSGTGGGSGDAGRVGGATPTKSTTTTVTKNSDGYTKTTETTKYSSGVTQTTTKQTVMTPHGPEKVTKTTTKAAPQPKDDPRKTGPQPILLDLGGDGVKITEYQNSTQFMTGKDGFQHRSSWAGAGDGVLFYDPDGRNAITEHRQYVFPEWNPTAAGDLVAHRSAWDTRGDGRLAA
ncbi:MAG: lysozyme [Microgenomates group bacterium]